MPNNGKVVTIANDGSLEESSAIATSAGVANASQFVMTASNGYLDPTLMPPGIGAPTKIAVASEALSAGNIVNVFNNASVLNVRKADASAGSPKPANGFVLANVANAANATVYLPGSIITGLAGLTPGADYFLSDSTPGGLVTVPVSGTGKIHQYVGSALSATELAFNPGRPIRRA